MTIGARVLVLVLATTTAAQAGGPTVSPADPEPASPAPVAAHDWTGPYVGLAYGTTSGESVLSNGDTFDLDSGATPSIFAGYMVQRGNLVFGGELAFARGDDVSLVGFPAEGPADMVDVKGRVGFAADRALFYGVLGYSSVDYDEGAAENESSGISYGLGVDFAVSERFTAGLEYLARRTEGDTFVAGLTRELEVNTLSLRVGLSF